MHPFFFVFKESKLLKEILVLSWVLSCPKTSDQTLFEMVLSFSLNGKQPELHCFVHNFIRQHTSLGCSPWRHEFRSLHIACTSAWNVYRRRTIFVGVTLGMYPQEEQFFWFKAHLLKIATTHLSHSPKKALYFRMNRRLSLTSFPRSGDDICIPI